MKKILITLALVVLAAGTTVASDKADAMKVVRQFVDAFNKGDTAAAVATCAEQTSIIDEFSPYEWHGAGACSQWLNDYDADAKKNGISGGVVTLGRPRHIDVAGDRAYIVVPANYTFRQNGKLVKEIGSSLTIALQKGAAGWRMTGWAWSKR